MGGQGSSPFQTVADTPATAHASGTRNDNALVMVGLELKLHLSEGSPASSKERIEQDGRNVERGTFGHGVDVHHEQIPLFDGVDDFLGIARDVRCCFHPRDSDGCDRGIWVAGNVSEAMKMTSLAELQADAHCCSELLPWLGGWRSPS